MGCYAETLAFLDRIGAADRVRWQSGLKVPMIDRRGHHSVLALPALPSPLHFLAGVLAWDALSWGERLSVLRIGVSDRVRANSRTLHDCTYVGQIRPSLAGSSNGQAPRLCELFWEPLALAALNQSIDQAEASHFIRVLERVFGPDPAAAALVLPAVPLDELYAEPARAWLDAARQRGARQRAGKGGHRWRPRPRRARARRGDRGAARDLDGAVARVSRAVRSDARRRSSETVANATALASLPIVTVNLWFDRRGHARAARRPAGPQLPMGLRSPRASSAATRRTCR